MKSLHELLEMGGYAAYVWPAYALAAVVLIVNAILPLRRLRRQLDGSRRGRTGREHP